MPGVTSAGFEAKRLADIVDDAEAQLALIVDPVSGQSLQPDLTSSDPAMQIAKVPLDGLAAAWEMAQLVFEQFDPNKANLNSLRALVQLNGLTQQGQTASVVTLTFGGSPAALVPAGTLVSDIGNTHQWATEADLVLDGAGMGSTSATCVDFGPVPAAAGTLTSIVTPAAGVLTVTNVLAAQLGRDAETLPQLRVRRERSTLAPSAGPVEAIYGNVANVPGVTYARVYQNNTLITDSRGIPPKSVAALVVGGDDVDIAMVLLARTGVSSGWAGTEAVTLYDTQNEPFVVRFSRPNPVPIYLAIEIEITDPSRFPANGLAAMKQAIIDYAEGGAPALGVTDGFGITGFPPGSPVIRSRLYTPLNYIPGHRVNELFLGTAPAPTGEADIVVDWDDYAQFTEANISITVAP